MSVKVSSWVWHGEETADLAGNEMVLLLALADVADDNGRCRYTSEDELTYATLATKARVSDRTVVRLVASLREAGLLDQVKGAKGRPNEFQIVVPWAEVSGDKLAPNDSGSGANLTPNNADSVSTATGFGVKPGSRTSLKRIDVNTTRGTRLPKAWKPSELLLLWAAAKAPSVDVATETENFSDYWIAAAGARGVKLDWDATWRTWMRRTHQRAVERGWTPAANSDPETDWMRTRA